MHPSAGTTWRPHGQKGNIMAVDKNESPVEKVVEFFTQGPEDRAYENAGGDDRVPQEQRTDDPKADANTYALANGEDAPYPGHVNPTDIITDDAGASQL